MIEHHIQTEDTIKSTHLAHLILRDMHAKGVIADYELNHNIKQLT